MLKQSIYFFFTVFLFYSYDWFQTDSLITIVIYTKQKVGVFHRRELQDPVRSSLYSGRTLIKWVFLFVCFFRCLWKDLNAELVIVDCQDNRLRGEIIIGDHSYLVEVGTYCDFCSWKYWIFILFYLNPLIRPYVFYIYQLIFYSSSIRDEYFKVPLCKGIASFISSHLHLFSMYLIFDAWNKV